MIHLYMSTEYENLQSTFTEKKTNLDSGVRGIVLRIFHLDLLRMMVMVMVVAIVL